MYALEKCWHPVAWSRELTNKPMAVTVLGKELVAFRDTDGKARVMDDRCLHKGVKLSRGRCSSIGIQCPYHGWEYDGSGKLARIPSQLNGDKLPNKSVKTYRVMEQQETVWFCFSDEPYEPAPLPWHYYERKDFFTTTFDMACNYVPLLENLVENTHARFVHDGLLRNSNLSTQVNAVVRETGRGIHSQTFGEKAKGSLLYRLFGDAEQELDHTEEYITPNIIRIIFGQPGKIHIASQLVCVPVDANNTRVFFRVALQCRFASLLLPLLKRMLVQGILTQDKGILEHEAAQQADHAKPSALSTKSDLPAVWVGRLARAYADHGPAAQDKTSLKQATVEYQL